MRRCCTLLPVNDYLCSAVMQIGVKALFEFLGFDVGVISPGLNSISEKQEASTWYYLRNNNDLVLTYCAITMFLALKMSAAFFAFCGDRWTLTLIVIDEARTPWLFQGSGAVLSFIVVIDIPELKSKIRDEERCKRVRAIHIDEKGNEHFDPNMANPCLKQIFKRKVCLPWGDVVCRKLIFPFYSCECRIRAHKMFPIWRWLHCKENELFIVDEAIIGAPWKAVRGRKVCIKQLSKRRQLNIRLKIKH